MKNKEILKKAESALLDILRGYSFLTYKNENIYFKHFSLIDSLYFDEQYQKSLESAIKSGIKEESQIIDAAIKSKKWSLQKEDEIKSILWTIDKLSNAAKKITDPFQRKSAESSIESKKIDLKKLQDERAKLCSYSAEMFAESKKIKHIISSSLYKDAGFSKKLEEEEQLPYYRLFFDKISDLNNFEIVVNAAYNTSFFDVFSLNYRTPHVILANAGMNMTVFQKNLMTYANAILNKLRNVNIPENIYGDPIKILNYKEPEKEETKKTSVGIQDLKEKSAKNGGKLNPEDFLT